VHGWNGKWAKLKHNDYFVQNSCNNNIISGNFGEYNPTLDGLSHKVLKLLPYVYYKGCTYVIVPIVFQFSYSPPCPYFTLLTDSSLTHLNVSAVLSSVSVLGVEACLRIPSIVRNKIAAQSESEEERRNRLVDWWLKTSPYASWQWLSGWSHRWEAETAESAAKRYFQRAPGEHSVT
jgi:hypothetical protein